MTADRSAPAPRRAVRRRRLAARPGFTLLEAVVAMTVVALASVSALSAFGAELRTADRVRRALPAAALAEERLRALALVPERELASLPDSVARGRFAAPLDGYAWSAEARRTPDSQALYDATVTVSWDGGAYALRTRFFRPRRAVVAGGAGERP